jgi:hypothetical protein
MPGKKKKTKKKARLDADVYPTPPPRTLKKLLRLPFEIGARWLSRVAATFPTPAAGPGSAGSRRR